MAGLRKRTRVPSYDIPHNDTGFVDDYLSYITPEAGFLTLQDCFDYAIDNSLAVLLGPYTYFVNSTINTSGKLVCYGYGESRTIIKQSSGIGVFSHINKTIDDMFILEGVKIVTTQDFNKQNRAIVVDSRPLLVGSEVTGRNLPKGRINNVEIEGSTSRVDGKGFGIGIDLISTGYMTLNNLQFIGCSSTDTPYKFKGIHILVRGDGKPVEIYITKVRGYSAEYGYLCPEYSEGVRFNDVNFVNCNNGVVCSPVSEYVIGTLGQVGCYEYMITDCHVNATTIGVMLNAARYCTISDNLFIMDDHGVTTSVNPVTVRSGSYNTLDNNKIVHFAVEGTTGITRAGVVFDAVSDSTCYNVKAKVEQNTYEPMTHAIRFINSSNRNRCMGINIQRATTAVSNASGCGSNQIGDYSFLDVITMVDDQNGDLDRRQTDSASVVFNPAGAAFYDIEVIPSRVFTRRPQGISLEQGAPLSANIKFIYDFDNSTPTLIKIRAVPFTSGSLPNVNCRLLVLLHD